jgi:hypothetical protein
MYRTAFQAAEAWMKGQHDRLPSGAVERIGKRPIVHYRISARLRSKQIHLITAYDTIIVAERLRDDDVS